MPIYEYRCSSCGHELEALQKLADAPLVACPSCHADALVKRVSASAFQLKGSGWYATDFKGGGKPVAAKTTDETKPGGDAASESKVESKSESGTESKAESKAETKSVQKADTATPSSGPSSAST